MKGEVISLLDVKLIHFSRARNAVVKLTYHVYQLLHLFMSEQFEVTNMKIQAVNLKTQESHVVRYSMDCVSDATI